MKNCIPFVLVLLLFYHLGFSQPNSEYKYSVDLTRVENDRVFVELLSPSVNVNEIVFCFPKIIPGTYSIADYGRYVSEIKAFDRRGRELNVKNLDANRWQISDATRLAKITYWVDDILDTHREGPGIYPMAATNIEEGKNFVINTSGFFGYLENTKDVPIRFDIIRPKEFYGSTGLIALQTGEPLPKVKKEISIDNSEKRVDRYAVENYDRLIDSPLMYAKPDTAVIQVNGTEVLIGSYSPTGKITAKQIANTVREVLMAQANYLGGKLPVDKYAFLFYFVDKPLNSYGALEHWYSSFYYMPELPIEKMEQQLRDFAAHEFFHIVTPLNIHSEEIHRFGFNDPQMSKHLWMYEGVTEYFAGNVQVKYGLITTEDYLDKIRQKMIIASGFLDDVPFTDISKFTLDKYADQYYNVYQKGALIGMCLDIKLRKLSDGAYGLQNLMADLAKKYGKSQPFRDDELFSEIEKLTYPAIGDFLRRHVEGSEKLPYSEIFEQVGVNYTAEKTIQEFSLGFKNNAIGVVDLNGKKKLTIAKLEELNEQGLKLNFQKGDVLLKINGEAIPDLGPDLGNFIERQESNLKDGGHLSYFVLRINESGERKEIELTAPVVRVEVKQRHLLSFKENVMTPELELRKAWLTAE